MYILLMYHLLGQTEEKFLPVLQQRCLTFAPARAPASEVMLLDDATLENHPAMVALSWATQSLREAPVDVASSCGTSKETR